MKTFSAKPKEVRRDWYLVDADGRTLGRLASEIAQRLRGKHKAIYTPHIDTGDYIIVVNAEKIRITGRKLIQKRYYRHTGYPGGIKSLTLGQLLEKAPEQALEIAVRECCQKILWAEQCSVSLKSIRGLSILIPHNNPSL